MVEGIGCETDGEDERVTFGLWDYKKQLTIHNALCCHSLSVSMAIVSCSFVALILLLSPLDNQNMHDISKLSLIIGFNTSIMVSNFISNSILCKEKSSIQ